MRVYLKTWTDTKLFLSFSVYEPSSLPNIPASQLISPHGQPCSTNPLTPDWLIFITLPVPVKGRLGLTLGGSATVVMETSSRDAGRGGIKRWKQEGMGEGTVGQVQGHRHNTIVFVTSITEKKRKKNPRSMRWIQNFGKNEAILSWPVLKKKKKKILILIFSIS